MIRDAGMDPRLLEADCGRYWTAYEFEKEKLAQRCWEACERECVHISCWRTKSPTVPPYRHFVVWTVGEKRELLDKAVELCERYRGTPYDPPDAGMIYALRRRRMDLAVDRALTRGDLKQKARYGGVGGMIMDSEGKLHPRQKPQG